MEIIFRKISEEMHFVTVRRKDRSAEVVLNSRSFLISDYLELPDLLDKGRRLRGKTGFVLCTSVYDEPSPAFIEAFAQTFAYLGMNFGGYLHANCREGYEADRHENEVCAFIPLLK